jgi:hypothetical protein
MCDERTFHFSPMKMRALPARTVAARSAHARSRLLAAMLGSVLLVCCGRDPCQRLARARGPAEEEGHSLLSEPQPRCASDEPACGPEPFDSSGPACFDATKARKRLPVGAASQRGGQDQACAHDGECRLAGCGEVCVHYSLGRIRTNCKAQDGLDENAFCGCVDNECAFFEQ